MATERFTLTYQDTDHVVTVSSQGVKRIFTWVSDEVCVATKTSMSTELTIRPQRRGKNDDADEDSGGPKLEIKCGWFSVQRVALAVDDIQVDLVPDPRTPAARREQRIREHPTLHTLIATSLAIVKIVAPILLAGLAVTIALPLLSLPRIPQPEIDLPAIPWPDINWPSIPWPDIKPPNWLKWILANFGYIAAVVTAFVIARGEVRRRRKQDERRSAGQPVSGTDKPDHKNDARDDSDHQRDRPD